MAKYFKKSSRGSLSPELAKKGYRDKYVVFGKTGDEDDPIPYGTVTAGITNERSYPNFDFSNIAPDDTSYTKVAKNTGVSREYMETHTDNYGFYTGSITDAETSANRIRGNRGDSYARILGIDYAKRIKTFKNDQDFQPTELFTTKPKSVEITGAHVDPSLKSSFLTIGAMIHKEHGVPITSSDDLSRWSSAVSRNAQEKGLPVMGNADNPDMAVTNDIDSFQHFSHTTGKDYMDDISKTYTAIPDHEVKDARQHLRGLLGREPKQHMSQQFNNVPLPGMENF